ncbi:MAG: FAD-dependent 5-carboxymethylaminomethyl-2-thiouridine(34) oxidoreductase MnmC [Alphaproteobacteria bacterium]|nr:FAD-dependent 5-carboxymethylaminomethyl-2-thiouridine(34) oxidoreductase MnmC [Alphaproteobacteria bacterium]
MRVAIIGAGLAGCALAYVLKNAGAEPVIYEAGDTLASGASGNPSGLYNPRLSATFSPEAEFYSGAFARALTVFSALTGLSLSQSVAQPDNILDWNPCGALHLLHNEKKDKQFTQTAQNWPAPRMQLLEAQEASVIAGIEIRHRALYLPDSGTISPRKLCEFYAQGVEVHTNAPLSSAAAAGLEGADILVLACGMGVSHFRPEMPLRPVRGQLSFAKASLQSVKLRTNLCYSGHISAPLRGMHVLGSTFHKNVNHAHISPDDDAENLLKLEESIPALSGLETEGSRAAVRTTSRDHFPVVGRLEDRLYISTAHGSHGILSTLLSAEIIAAMILGRPSPVSEKVRQRLSPARFSS